MFPDKMKIISTDNDLKLLEVIKIFSRKLTVGRYIYLTGNYHKGTEVDFTESEIEKMLRNNLITI